MNRLVKMCLVVLSAVLIVFASTNLLRNTSWVYSPPGEQSGILLQFDDEIVHARFRCLTAEGNYSINGSTGLQIQLHTLDTTCEDSDNLIQYHTEYESMIDLLNAISAFSYQSSASELRLFTVSNDTLRLRISYEVLPYEPLSGKWYSLHSGSSLEFFDNGDVECFDGCNSGWGRFSTQNETLTLYNMTMTLVACPDQESDVPYEMPESGAFSFSGDTLIIAESDYTYYYTRTDNPLRIGYDLQREKYRQPGKISSSEVTLFDIKGRALRGNKAAVSRTMPAGIVLRRNNGQVRASVTFTGGRTE